MYDRPSTQLQQFVTIFSVISSMSMSAFGCFGLPVSAMAYSIIEPKNACPPTENCAAVEMALHTEKY